MMMKFVLLTNLDRDEHIWNDINYFSKPESLDLIYWTAIISSWIFPNTVWRNYKTDSYLTEKERKKNMSIHKLYLLIMSSMTTAIELVIIGILALTLNYSDLLPMTEGSFLIQCTQNSSFANKASHNFSSIKFCTLMQDCHMEMRICENGERSSDLILLTVIPLSCQLLMLALLGSVGLQIFGAY